jgi:hypothetical protein
MENPIASPTQQSSSPSHGTPLSHKQAMATESQRNNRFIRNEGNVISNMPGQRLKVAILPMDLPCSGLIIHSGEILTTGKSHKKTMSKLFPKENSEMKEVL